MASGSAEEEHKNGKASLATMRQVLVDVKRGKALLINDYRSFARFV